MKLSKKVFIYTASTTFLVGLLIIAYFMFMLPGLYANHKSEGFITMIETLQRNMIQGEACNLSGGSNETLITLGITVPKEGYDIPLCNAYFSGTIHIDDAEVRETFDAVRNILIQAEDSETEFDLKAFETIDWKPLEKLTQNKAMDGLLTFEGFEGRNFFSPEDEVITDQRMTADNIMIMSTQVGDKTNNYSNYFAYATRDEAIYITVGSTMTPKLNELVPIVWGSVPMIFGLLVLMVLITAQWFSKKLATPIETLAKQAQQRNETDGVVFRQSNRGDEFETLEHALNTMHNDLKATVRDLDHQNKALIALQNKQEVFLMNASHQLKTPIASASLLVQGMADKVGKYKDTDVYLPKVSEELRRMQLIIESMMVIFQEKQNALVYSDVNVSEVLVALIGMQDLAFNHKNIHIENTVTPFTIHTDAEILASILENIMSNAVKYTPKNQTIRISNKGKHLLFLNEGVWIEDDLLESIAQPFVRTQNTKEKGTGLGLYLVDTFVSMLGFEWSIQNTDPGVLVSLDLEEKDNDYN